jgi:hypothetical protein
MRDRAAHARDWQLGNPAFGKFVGGEMGWGTGAGFPSGAT